jgi:hypothetical protein
LVMQVHGSNMATSEERVANGKPPVDNGEISTLFAMR